MNRRHALRTALLAPLAPLPSCRASGSEPMRIAIAGNFATAWKNLSAFAHLSDAQLQIAPTAALHSQIIAGMPCDVLFAANTQHPLDLVERGLADKPTTYALGQLSLVSTRHRFTALEQIVDLPGSSRVAIANPSSAPYGEAALESLASLSVAATIIRSHGVVGAWNAAITGAVDAAIVARSQVAHHLASEGDTKLLTRRPISTERHSPIRQTAVRILAGRHPDAAESLLALLQGDDYKDLITRHGYLVPPS